MSKPCIVNVLVEDYIFRYFGLVLKHKTPPQIPLMFIAFIRKFDQQYWHEVPDQDRVPVTCQVREWPGMAYWTWADFFYAQVLFWV